MIPWITGSSYRGAGIKRVKKSHGRKVVSAISGAVRFTGSADGVKVWGTGMWLPQWLMKRVPDSTAAAAARLLVVVGATIARRPELVALPLLLTLLFSGAAVSVAATAREWEVEASPQLFLFSTSSMCSSPPTFTDSEVWNSPGLDVAHMCLSSTVHVLLLVDWRERQKWHLSIPWCWPHLP